MIRCLCCGKELTDKASDQEIRSGWHKACIRRFFGVETLPVIDITDEALQEIAMQTADRGYTVPGVQRKMSLHLSKERKDDPRLTLVNYPTGYILKPQTEEYLALPEAEYLVMRMAEKTGIKTVPFALLHTKDTKDSFAYITRRLDRELPAGRNGKLKILAMEDFCQLDGRLTQDKYRGSYERCAKIVSRYSVSKGLDLSELYLRIVFSYAVGNSDMHLKNFSLIETEAESGQYVLSAAYDLLPVNIIVPEDTEQMALTLNGKKRNIRYSDFMAFAEAAGISKEAAKKMTAAVVAMKQEYQALCETSYLPETMKESLATLISERMEELDR